MKINFKEKILPVLLLPVKYAVVLGVSWVILLLLFLNYDLSCGTFPERIDTTIAGFIFIIFGITCALTAPAITYILLFSSNKLTINTYIVGFLVLYLYFPPVLDILYSTILIISISFVNIIHFIVIKAMKLKPEKRVWNKKILRKFLSLLMSFLFVFYLLNLSTIFNIQTFLSPIIVVLLYFIFPIFSPLFFYLLVFRKKISHISLINITLFYIFLAFLIYLSCISTFSLYILIINIILPISICYFLIKKDIHNKIKIGTTIYMIGFMLYLIFLIDFQRDLNTFY